MLNSILRAVFSCNYAVQMLKFVSIGVRAKIFCHFVKNIIMTMVEIEDFLASRLSHL